MENNILNRTGICREESGEREVTEGRSLGWQGARVGTKVMLPLLGTSRSVEQILVFLLRHCNPKYN